MWRDFPHLRNKARVDHYTCALRRTNMTTFPKPEMSLLPSITSFPGSCSMLQVSNIQPTCVEKRHSKSRVSLSSVRRQLHSIWRKDRDACPRKYVLEMNYSEYVPCLQCIKNYTAHDVIYLSWLPYVSILLNFVYMGVSENGGIPKWMVYNGKPY